MKIEFQCTDEILSNKELLDIINKAQAYSFVNKISVLPSYVKFLKNKISSNINLSTVIDYPLGILDTETKKTLVRKAVVDGANSVEVVLPSFLVNNKLNLKIKQDIEQLYNVCSEEGISLHYMLEYRSYNYSCLSRIVKLLLKHDLNSIYISTGHKIDDIYDHLIAVSMIGKSSPEANLICNANIFNEKHIDLLKMADLSHFRVNNLNALDIISRKY